MNKQFPEEIHITNEYMKRYSNLLVIGEYKKNYKPIRNRKKKTGKKVAKNIDRNFIRGNTNL